MKRFTTILVAALVLAAITGPAVAKDGKLVSPYIAFPKFPGGLPIYGGYGVGPALQADGKLVIAASRYTSLAPYNGANPSNPDFGVMRLNADGTVDSGFGSNGAAHVAFDRVGGQMQDIVSGVALQSDGKIVVAGFIDGNGSDTDFAAVRFDADGTLDMTFGTLGKTIVPFNLGQCLTVTSACADIESDVSVQADDKLLLVGQAGTTQAEETPTNAMALVRLTAGGVRDMTFGLAGRVTLNFASGDQAQGFRARQLADGEHILVVGTANRVAQGSDFDFAFAKLDSAGQLDTSFGSGGKATYAFEFGGESVAAAVDFVELPDGRLVLCGQAKVNNPYNYDFACMRFLANGTPDPSFAPVLIPFDAGGLFLDAALTMKRDSQGRLVLAGIAEGPSENLDMAVVRLLPNGVLDERFGNGGMATFASCFLFCTDMRNGVTGLALLPDDRIVLAGTQTYDASDNQAFELVWLIGDTIFDNNFEGD